MGWNRLSVRSTWKLVAVLFAPLLQSRLALSLSLSLSAIRITVPILWVRRFRSVLVSGSSLARTAMPSTQAQCPRLSLSSHLWQPQLAVVNSLVIHWW
ncbi:hypothetical protein J3F83DRAFT_647330 [Trichoderma novae-zelandiae]